MASAEVQTLDPEREWSIISLVVDLSEGGDDAGQDTAASKGIVMMGQKILQN